MKSASETALASFGDAKLEDIAPLDIPFSSITQESKSPRNEYITLDRIIKYGATPGCRACACSSEHSVHNLICRARFNALIRTDRIASRTKTPVSPRPIAPQTPLPVTDVASDGVEEGISDHEREATDEPVQDADGQLPFSAGIPPGESEPALINRVASTIDEAFVRSSFERARHRRMNTLVRNDTLFEFACSDSIMGDKLKLLGFRASS